MSQQLHSVVRASVGERVLLRVTNGNVDSYFTHHRPGPADEGGGPRCADRARAVAAAADSWAHETASITLGGGDGIDVLIDTGLAAGTYYLYTTNLNLLSNGPAKTAAGLMTTFVLQ